MAASALWLPLLVTGCSEKSGTEGGAYWVCVTNERSGDLTILDGATRKKIATVALGQRPRGIHASPDGKTLYVALSGSPITPPSDVTRKEPSAKPAKADRPQDGIGVVDLATKRLVRTLRVGPDPEEFAVSLDGSRLFVSNEDAGTVSIVNTGTGTIERVVRVSEEPEGARFTPDGRMVYVACEARGEVFVLDADDGSIRSQVALGGRPRSVAFSPDGSRAFIPSETTGNVRVLDTRTGRVHSDVRLPPGSRPMGVTVREDGKRVYVTNGRAGTVTVHDSQGALLHVIRVGARPWGLDLSPDEKLLYVANGPSNDVSVIDLSKYREITRIPVGESPWGVEIVRAQEPSSPM